MPLHLNKLNFMVEPEEKITSCAVTVSPKCPDNGADLGFVSRSLPALARHVLRKTMFEVVECPQDLHNTNIVLC